MTKRQSFLSLGIKSRIVNKSIDKDPQVALHIMSLDVGILVLLIYKIHHIVCNLIGDVINMGSTLDCGNRIHKADLLKEKKKRKGTLDIRLA
jgi:hypothetical protein